MQMNDTELDIDPNAPTENQLKLKRAEVAIRRRGSAALLMRLDEITFVRERPLQMQALQKLKKDLENS